MNWDWIKTIVQWAVIVVFLGYAYQAYRDYQDMIANQITLAESVATLESANQVNQATIEAMEQQARENQMNITALEEELQASEERILELAETLVDGRLENLAVNKPGLIERRINDATQDVFSNIECLTDPNCVQ